MGIVVPCLMVTMGSVCGNEGFAWEYVDAYKNVLVNPQKCYYATDNYIRFMDEMKPFYEDGANYEECLNGFKDYIKVYLTE